MTSPLQQKLKITGPVVVTANRLGDGAVRPGNLREHIRLNGPTVALPVTLGI